jgi:hypothetical protein
MNVRLLKRLNRLNRTLFRNPLNRDVRENVRGADAVGRANDEDRAPIAPPPRVAADARDAVKPTAAIEITRRIRFVFIGDFVVLAIKQPATV